MPYVSVAQRETMERFIPNDPAIRFATAGDMNYSISTLLLRWIGPDPHYSDYNAVIGVLECAKLEMYRQQVAAYEDEAKAKNGPLQRCPCDHSVVRCDHHAAVA